MGPVKKMRIQSMIRGRPALTFFLLTSFLILTLFVAKQATRPLDLAVTNIIQSFASERLDYAMYFFTVFGSIEFSSFALLVVCWYFYRKYAWPGVFLYLFFFMALSGVEFIWKYIVAYTGPGPEFDRTPFHWSFVTVRTPFAFPSGHTFRSVYLLGMWYQRLNQKLIPAGGSILFQKMVVLLLILGVGVSRIYLGDHWLSDVAGGCLLAAIGLLLVSQSSHAELRPA
jgi:undecaprenyl-diphosphatase